MTPRKLPAQSRALMTVEAILEAAARILEGKGPETYTTNNVAEKAGVSIGSLYQYFPNKDALTIAVIERETSALLNDVDAVRRETSFASGMARLIDAAVDYQMRRPALAVRLDFEEKRLPAGERHARVSETIAQALIDLFACEDAPAVADPSLVAGDLFGLARGMIDAAGERGETDAAALARRVGWAVFGYIDAAETGD